MQTLQLDIEYDYDFEVYGVTASVKEYKLAWALNKLLGFRLIKQEDLCYEIVQQERLIISNYEYITDHSVVRLLKNKALGMKAFLLPELKEYDYVLQITGPLLQLYPQELINKLLRIPLVQYVKHFDPLTLKLKENLIF
ncbi:IPExxxVDY family protein [Pontibacter sp. E15-1]|uniref:IPExxxVDY family protein n=1 Tax=Pontibacter sp. E15-1 TaxID=2919918 RepID=UPI001F4FF8DE|nr:IPExxxVDY family protein [Pontibacter sp. E15-1]MCJ8166512.1 IPExxxVDY family protein [Pontibacter sp. E15-1]